MNLGKVRTHEGVGQHSTRELANIYLNKYTVKFTQDNSNLATKII